MSMQFSANGHCRGKTTDVGGQRGLQWDPADGIARETAAQHDRAQCFVQQRKHSLFFDSNASEVDFGVWETRKFDQRRKKRMRWVSLIEIFAWNVFRSRSLIIWARIVATRTSVNFTPTTTTYPRSTNSKAPSSWTIMLSWVFGTTKSRRWVEIFGNVIRNEKKKNHFSRFFRFSQLPTYILTPNAHDKSYVGSRFVKLGGNELHCDCNTAKYLKVSWKPIWPSSLSSPNCSFILLRYSATGVAPNPDFGLGRGSLWKREGKSSGSRAIQNVRLSGRLDRLYLLHNRHRDLAPDEPRCQSLLRLLGLQNCRLFAMAGKQNAQIAVRLAVWDVNQLHSLQSQWKSAIGSRDWVGFVDKENL